MIALVSVAQAQELVVASPGKHVAKDGKISIEASHPDDAHLRLLVRWEAKRSREDGGAITSVWEDGPVELPVIARRWAFCFVGVDEVWFFDGKASFYRYKGTPDGLTMTCADPKLGDTAPNALKKWIAKAAEPGATDNPVSAPRDLR